ncbi:hypothetical protein CAOG_01622 [Capsaspora owczarzaki ATCC 30864]|uniref:Coatomer subunit epsilon n=1 Tax=Capsaspora owczarzaki (strain ATCC 30864) TaxID=595528 RepID=A0A0D2X169_CAPO3|nr:hypothetical protein CAOG_01622 [Capsaspora owczarzaki ATCC 30864]KJE90289.1 hypothetical protein CAOG_001622 [Capsaspora owczarzaki ATCC 30864]|eukprot:XP_004364490.1 hypothetical protein CAOG_01622 [Capsaspora owczarzaki ATCC 30864]
MAYQQQPQQQQQQTDTVLFPLRTAFYLGNYAAAITEGVKLAGKAQLDLARAIEAKTLVYRAYIAQKKYNLVIGELGDANAPVELRAVAALATFLKSERDQEAALTQVRSLAGGALSAANPFVAFIAAIMIFHQGGYDEVLKLLHNSTHLESIALCAQAYLRLDLVERAKKELKRMQEIDDDSTLTQLTNAWVNLAVGGDKYQEAYFIFQEMAEKYSPTVALLNGQAVCHLHQGRLEEAESLLQEALSKDSSDPDTIANLVTVSIHQNKPQEVINRFVNQLKDEAPAHPFTRDLLAKERAFDRAAEQFAPQVKA